MWTTLVGLFTKRLAGKAAGLTNMYEAVKSAGQGINNMMSPGQSDAASQLANINTVGAGASQDTGIGAGASKEPEIGAGVNQFIDATDTIRKNRSNRLPKMNA